MRSALRLDLVGKMYDEEEEDEFDEEPPSLREILAGLFYKLMQRLRGLILRWRFLSLTGKAVTCFCLCVVLPVIFFTVTVTVQRIIDSPRMQNTLVF